MQNSEEIKNDRNYFDNKEFSTILVNRDGFGKSENDIADLVDELLEVDNYSERNLIATELKKHNAQAILIETIDKTKNIQQKKNLCTACWESGLDFSNHFIFFVELVFHSDFELALEALTVIESLEIIEENSLTKALVFCREQKVIHDVLVKDLLHYIKSRLN